MLVVAYIEAVVECPVDAVGVTIRKKEQYRYTNHRYTAETTARHERPNLFLNT